MPHSLVQRQLCGPHRHAGFHHRPHQRWDSVVDTCDGRERPTHCVCALNLDRLNRTLVPPSRASPSCLPVPAATADDAR